MKDGDGEAMWMLGLCCEYGMGTEQDVQRAESLYLESLRSGSVVGDFLVAHSEFQRGSGEMKVMFCL